MLASVVTPKLQGLAARERPNKPAARGACRLVCRAARDQQSWRDFRATLLGARTSGSVDSLNSALVRLQDPALAAEPAWAHTLPSPEAGGLLLATPAAHQLLGPDFWQAVVLLLKHDPQGSLGLVLNRPTHKRMGLARGADGLEVPAEGGDDGLFNSRVYWGGPAAEDSLLLLLHGDPRRRQRGSLAVPCGLFLERSQLGISRVAGGLAQGGTLRFFSGCCTWGPGELDLQMEQGAWQPAACSRSVALKHAALLEVGLWTEVMCMLGGEYADAACQL